jgi:glycine/sarcosine N-methyltransferase
MIYDSFSNDYDRFVNWPGRLALELPFLEEQLKAAGGRVGLPIRVLDAAAGTGMHVIALVQRGYLAAGADLSAGMVERARQNARQAGVEARFAAAGFGDMAEAFWDDLPYDAVLCLGNSLPHLLTPESLAAALSDFAACLGPGGLLVIQNRNFDAVLSERQRWMEPQSNQEGKKEWIFLRFYDFRQDGLIDFNILTLYREAGGGWRQRVSTTQLYPQRKVELVEALQKAGFHQIRGYGGMNRLPFIANQSGNLVVTARKI